MSCRVYSKQIDDRYRDTINLATGWNLTTEEIEESPPEELQMMLDRYYAFRGWDQEDGTPTPETIERLDLVDIV